MSIFDTVNEDDIIKEIMELEVNRMSPLDALNTLDKLQAKLKKPVDAPVKKSLGRMWRR